MRSKRDLKCTNLASLEKQANALAARRDMFNLGEECNFTYQDILVLLTPSYFKDCLVRIYSKLQGNLCHLNRTWN